MAVDVVVVNYRTTDLLREFVRSYEKHKFTGCTLTIVDVDPVPGHFLITNPVDTLWLTVTENCGYGKACNGGAARGDNDVILLANADTLLTEGFVECYDALMANHEWGVLGPRQINEHNQITAGGIFGHPQAPTQRGWMEQDTGYFGDVRDDALTVSGALYFVKRKVWQELTECLTFQRIQPSSLGAFLETNLYYEETFCSYHVRAHGYKCVYYGPVQMTHYWHKSIDGGGGFGEREFAISKGLHQEACAIHNIECER